MSKERAFEIANEKADRTDHPHWVYQRSNGKWYVAARERFIPRGVINYRRPCFEVRVVARCVLTRDQ